MGTWNILEDLAVMASVLKEDMTIEQAIDIVDMENNSKPEFVATLPDSRIKCQALMVKANMMVVNYVREHLAKEKGE